MREAILSGWKSEIVDSLSQSKSFCLAVFSTTGELIFANATFQMLLKGDACKSLLNPDFDKIVSLPHDAVLIFNGFLTIGTIDDVNTSIFAHIYRKNDQLLIIGGMDMLNLTEQNRILHEMNAEITHLQRQLLQKTLLQEQTLSKLNAANEELLKANQDKDKFLKILAHDLKNPMFAISGFSDLLIKNFRKYDESTIEKQLGIINTTTKKTYDLLEELLLWTRSQSGKIPFEPRTVQLKKVCDDVLSLLNESAATKQIEIIPEIDAGLELHADVDMLRTILRNLISNAIKFTHENGQIILRAEQQDTDMIITVSDNGIGMSQEVVSRLWQIAELYTSPGTKGEKGTGLGLMLCKEFVEKHNGRIWVESEVGKGSDFKIALPVREV
ncbi:MAG: HAMP domain-containing sensor histidine kinase [Lentimicrobium sp.]|jgi:signal transduction histidine kinase|nr:HAMP domain-containing sensor histidine kinase [Lentimicrobium sp.]